MTMETFVKAADSAAARTLFTAGVHIARVKWQQTSESSPGRLWGVGNRIIKLINRKLGYMIYGINID